MLQYDFLSVEVMPKENSSNISSIFSEESFDIVVLSLVLEYLPVPEQRAVFCYKSWKLLIENGLCIIITPDSKSVSHNAHMMKSWKLGMEKIGFIRVKYEKLTHIHCMAFRKLNKEDKTVPLNSISKFFFIPQDFTRYSDEADIIEIERTHEEDLDIYSNFLELPNEDLF